MECLTVEPTFLMVMVKKICDLCGMHDDEKHRMNDYEKYRGVIHCDDQHKVSFDALQLTLLPANKNFQAVPSC